MATGASWLQRGSIPPAFAAHEDERPRSARHRRPRGAHEGRLEGARYVLGSATPSLESMTAATAPTVVTARPPDRPTALLRLPSRIDDRPLPPVELVDLRSAALVRTGHAVQWSEALDDALATTLSRHEQAIRIPVDSRG